MITLTEQAATKVRDLMQQQGLSESGLRLYVTGGGCAGFSYGLAFEDGASTDDEIIEQHGVKVFVDRMSGMYVTGAQIDYVDGLMGSGFSISNPNATHSCACGSSFSAEEEAPAETAPSMGGGCGCGH